MPTSSRGSTNSGRSLCRTVLGWRRWPTLQGSPNGASHAREELGGRFRIAVVAAGATQPDGSLRFAVEDLLGAGALIDALAEAGIDHQSPEAAAAATAYTGLRRATTHLINASVSAREARTSPEAV